MVKFHDESNPAPSNDANFSDLKLKSNFPQSEFAIPVANVQIPILFWISLPLYFSVLLSRVNLAFKARPGKPGATTRKRTSRIRQNEIPSLEQISLESILKEQLLFKSYNQEVL